MAEPEPPAAIERRIEREIAPGARGQLLARGLARGIIWNDGVLPPEAPSFSPELSSDLLDHGYGVLTRALRLREINPESDVLDDAFRVAAESIESVVRRGDPEDPSRGFRLLVAAVASHLGGYAARAYSLIGSDLPRLNLASDEVLIALTARRSLETLRHQCLDWLGNSEHGGAAIVQRLSEGVSEFEVGDALDSALRLRVHRAVGLLDSALVRGDRANVDQALELLRIGRDVAAESGNVPAWWVHILLQHLCDDLWKMSLWERLPSAGAGESDEQWPLWRRRFIDVLMSRATVEATLWPSQLEAAARAVDAQDDLVVALPTSAGKTRIAEMCILRALADGRRVVYLTPLRALSAQQERALARTFRPLGARVTSLYGASGVAYADVATFESAHIVVATPEKLDFALRHQPAILDDVGLVILDEGHMIGINEREVRYEALVQRLLSREDADDRRLVCLSAIFGPGEMTADFRDWLRSDEPGTAIESQWRPTRHRTATVTWDGRRGRLDLSVDDERPFVQNFIQSQAAIRPRRNAFPHDHVEIVLATADKLVSEGANVLLYCTQRNFVDSVAAKLVALVERGYLGPYPIDGEIERAQRIGEEWLGADHDAVAALGIGVAVHHGALPRPFLGELEDLLARRVLRLAIASPTVAQGLDLSASALVFHSLYRSGQPIEEEEYKNVIGRVGRAFVDLDGLSVLPVDSRERSMGSKLALYRSLIRGTGQRSLESGIALLIEHLISRVATDQALPAEQAVEYLLGQTGDWTPTEGEPDENFAELVANLDSAILSTVEDLDAQADDLPDLIDLALRNSLWRRTLGRRTIEAQALQRRLLVGRARWIWSRTSGPARRGFFASGLGFEAGSAIDSQIDALAGLVSAADSSISNGDIAVAAQHLADLEERLEGVRPLRARTLPENWRMLLAAWISGESVAVTSSDANEFVQDGLVYRLVWAVEAIRAHAEVVGVDIELSGGQSSMALTYGVPTTTAAALLRHGLPSRRLALDVAERYPPREDDTDPELGDWVGSLADQVDTNTFFDPRDVLLWREFIAPTSTRIRPWAESTLEFEVEWFGEPPGVGTELRAIADESSTHVCGLDLTPLGQIERAVTHIRRAWVTDDLRLRLERFGPPL